jgi:adenylate kinase
MNRFFPRMSSRLRCILLGAPGSGKGTIANKIVKDFRLKHLSSGDLLRKNIDNKTPVGLKAKEYVGKGALLPDEFITKLIVDEIHTINKHDWLLDGFPRTKTQAESLDENGDIKYEAVVNLNVPFTEITNRLKHRWIHSSSGRVYNLEYNPPKVTVSEKRVLI